MLLVLACGCTAASLAPASAGPTGGAAAAPAPATAAALRAGGARGEEDLVYDDYLDPAYYDDTPMGARAASKKAEKPGAQFCPA